MLSKKLIQYFVSVGNRRFISQSVKNFESKATDSATKANVQTGASEAMPGRSKYKTTGFDKWILTWVKRYPKGQVPELISEDTIYQAKSKARVKAANYMMAATVLMCLGTVFYAKGLVKKGDSIQKRREDWHGKIKEEARIERENTASK